MGKYHDNELLKPFTDIVSVKSDNPSITKLAKKKFNILNYVLKDESLFKRNFNILGSNVKLEGYGGLGKIIIETPKHKLTEERKQYILSVLGKVAFFNNILYYPSEVPFSAPYPIIIPQILLSISVLDYFNEEVENNRIILPLDIKDELIELISFKNNNSMYRMLYPNTNKLPDQDRLVCSRPSREFTGNIAYIYGGAPCYLELYGGKKVYLPYSNYSHSSHSGDYDSGTSTTHTTRRIYRFTTYATGDINTGKIPDNISLVSPGTVDYHSDNEVAVFYVLEYYSGNTRGGRTGSPSPAVNENFSWSADEGHYGYSLNFMQEPIFSSSAYHNGISIYGNTDCHMNLLTCENGYSASCLGISSPTASVSEFSGIVPVIDEFGEFGGQDWAAYKRDFGDWLYSIMFKVYDKTYRRNNNVCFTCYCPDEGSSRSINRCYWGINTEYCQDMECTKCATTITPAYTYSAKATHYILLPNKSIKKICENGGDQYTDRFGIIHPPTGEFVWQYSFTFADLYLLLGDQSIPFLYRETPSIRIYDVSDSYLGILFDTVTIIQYIIMDVNNVTYRFGLYLYFTYKDKPAAQGELFMMDYKRITYGDYTVRHKIIPYDNFVPSESVDPNVRYNPYYKLQVIVQPFNYFYKGEPILYEINENGLDFPNKGIEISINADDNVDGINVYLFNFNTSGKLNYTYPYKWIGTSYKDKNGDIKFIVRWLYPFKYSSDNTRNGILFYGFNWNSIYNNSIGVLNTSCEVLEEAILYKYDRGVK